MNIGSPNPKDRFTSRVTDYRKFRPTYPLAVVSLLGNACTIADIGSGTGIFSGLLLEAGHTVFAIEPNSAMRETAEAAYSGHERFHSVPGEAEATLLGDKSVDAITAAQSFHWFATPRAVHEFARILADGGRIMLLWNERKTNTNRFHKEYEELLQRYGTDYAVIDHRNITAEKVQKLFQGWDCQIHKEENHQLMDLQGLKGRIESSSYSPPRSHPHHQPLMEGIESLFHLESTGGLIRMEYDCVVYLLQKPDEGK